MTDSKDSTIALNVRSKPSDSFVHPRAVNSTNAGDAQGIAYLDFGFIKQVLLDAITKTAKDGRAVTTGLDEHLVGRVAMTVSALARLQQQMQQVMVGLRDSRRPKAKG